ncbi:MAG: type 4a pilus biogenesis protein PilO [Planctomycetes bacterium]|nr:type 4a pilus biogenesis protein PilO [Planctomycetota bacterium]
MNRLSEKQLLILTIGITVLLCGGIGFLIWKDLESVKEEEEQTSNLRTQIDTAEREIAQTAAREYRVISDREMADKEVAFLPEESEIETFWEVLERFAVESGVRISEITPSTSRGDSKSKGPIDSVSQVLSLRGTVDEFLRFLNFVENYDRIINVTEYSIGAGEVKDEDGKVRHGIKLALTTFTYSKKIANTIVSIQSYDKKKEHPEVKKWLSRIKIQEKETYTLRTSLGRRDPFENVRQRIEVTDNPLVDRAAQQEMVENLVEMIRTLQEGLEIEDHLRKIKDLFRLAQQLKENRESLAQLARLIDQVRGENLVTVRELQERFRTDVQLPFLEIQERLSKVQEDEPRMTLAMVEETRARAFKLFEARDWRKVDELVRNFMDVSRGGDWVEEDARSLVVEINDLLRRSQVIEKFEKRKIDISSILYSPNAVSIAVVNRKQFIEGDALDGDGRVIVFEIGENFVIFETEGVEIKRTLNGK